MPSPSVSNDGSAEQHRQKQQQTQTPDDPDDPADPDIEDGGSGGSLFGGVNVKLLAGAAIAVAVVLLYLKHSSSGATTPSAGDVPEEPVSREQAEKLEDDPDERMYDINVDERDPTQGYQDLIKNTDVFPSLSDVDGGAGS